MLFSPENPYLQLLKEEQEFLPLSGDENFDTQYSTYKQNIENYDKLSYLLEEDESIEVLYEEGVEEFSKLIEQQIQYREEEIDTIGYIEEKYGDYLNEHGSFDSDDLDNVYDIVDKYGISEEDIFEYVKENKSDLDLSLVSSEEKDNYVIVGHYIVSDSEEEEIYFGDTTEITIRGKQFNLRDFLNFIPEEQLKSLFDKYVEKVIYSYAYKQLLLSLDKFLDKQSNEISFYIEISRGYYNNRYDIGVETSKFIKDLLEYINDKEDTISHDDNSFFEED